MISWIYAVSNFVMEISAAHRISARKRAKLKARTTRQKNRIREDQDRACESAFRRFASLMAAFERSS